MSGTRNSARPRWPDFRASALGPERVHQQAQDAPTLIRVSGLGRREKKTHQAGRDVIGLDIGANRAVLVARLQQTGNRGRDPGAGIGHGQGACRPGNPQGILHAPLGLDKGGIAVDPQPQGFKGAVLDEKAVDAGGQGIEL